MGRGCNRLTPKVKRRRKQRAKKLKEKKGAGRTGKAVEGWGKKPAGRPLKK